MARKPATEIDKIQSRKTNDADKGKYVLRLYVAGTSRRSFNAIKNLKALLEEKLPGRYHLEIIDIYQQPIFAKSGQIVAAPTLIKELPPPLRKMIGDLSDTERVLMGLDLTPAK